MPKKASTSARDRVCGMQLDGLSNILSITHDKKEYSFCGEACARRFKSSPSRFLGTPLIRLSNIRKTFKTGTVETQVLRGLDLHIWEGDFVVIIGASGSGKSTVLNILGLLDRPTSGEIFIKNTNAIKLSEDERATLRSRTFGFIFQQYNLIPWLTVYENAMLPRLFAGLPIDRQAIERSFADVGLEHRMHHRPRELSGGEQQRVAFVRALTAEPAIVLGDEPTGNLDSATGEKILEYLIHENKEHHRTLVIVSHDSYIAERADQIIHVKDGVSIQNHRGTRGLYV